MRGVDQRSRRIALVPDRLVNAHLLPAGDPERDILTAALDRLERLGFGLLQLPPHDLPFERVRAALDFAIDQLQDYARHGYRLVRVDLPHLPASGTWCDRFDAELARRSQEAIGVVALDLTDIGAATFESNLRQPVFPGTAASAAMSAETQPRSKAPS